MPRVREMYSAMASRKSGKPGRRTVAGPALVQRLLRRVLDVLRRRKVGLADFQVDDVLALRFERAGALQHLERGLDPDPRHAFR